MSELNQNENLDMLDQTNDEDNAENQAENHQDERADAPLIKEEIESYNDASDNQSEEDPFVEVTLSDESDHASQDLISDEDLEVQVVKLNAAKLFPEFLKKIKSLSQEKIDALALKPVGGIPLVSLRGLSVFPGMMMHFDLAREKSIMALEIAMTQDQRLFVTDQKDPDEENPTKEGLYPAGCIVKVKQAMKMPDGSMRVLIDVLNRAMVTRFLSETAYFAVETQPIESVYSETKENRALFHLLKKDFVSLVSLTRRVNGDFKEAIENIDDPDLLVNLICSNLGLEGDDAQQMLVETDLNLRMNLAYEYLSKELEMAKIEQNIDQKVKTEINRNQKEYYLREQIRAIHEELGDIDTDERIEKYRARLEALDVPDEVRTKVTEEIDRLAIISGGSSESGVVETYIEWILDLPWNIYSPETVDVRKARRILNKDHYGLEKVKERILEYIAVRQLSGGLKSPILCLVGPPGVGKTSIARSIAQALNRKYVRMSLGGIRDEAEIRGHRRTYIGAIPGRIIYHLKQVGTANPLFLLDEIDKMGQDAHGDPASALLEVLDPEQNNTFTDNYLECPFDLSKVLFLTTANSLSTIPRPLLDRMEIIEVNGYVTDEKFEIAKRYLVPKQLEAHGLNKEQVKMSPKAIRDTIGYYTRESGVRELERQVAKICRVAAKEIVETEAQQISITPKNLERYLGRRRYLFETVNDQAEVGLVNGLAWTAVGGETLEIEVAVLPGKGNVVITGQLGDVMQESAKAALSYIRAHADELGIPEAFYRKNDLHLHVPEGAVPKDGPSAGITMTTAMISALTGQPVPRRLAMTGEITLRGRVLPIGGLREKLTAAHRAGVREIILPKANEKDLEEVPDVVLKALNIHPVETMTQVVDLVFKQKMEAIHESH